MRISRQLVLPILVMVAGFGVFASAQAKKPAAKMRVFFLEPKNGATVTSPVHMKFGSEGIQISPVPPGDITTTRPGMAHYHVGIRSAVSSAWQDDRQGHAVVGPLWRWKDVFDSQHTPGKHKLALQLGDDLHNTMPGRVLGDHGDGEIVLERGAGDAASPAPDPQAYRVSCCHVWTSWQARLRLWAGCQKWNNN